MNLWVLCNVMPDKIKHLLQQAQKSTRLNAKRANISSLRPTPDPHDCSYSEGSVCWYTRPTCGAQWKQQQQKKRNLFKYQRADWDKTWKLNVKTTGGGSHFSLCTRGRAAARSVETESSACAQIGAPQMKRHVQHEQIKRDFTARERKPTVEDCKITV